MAYIIDLLHTHKHLLEDFKDRIKDVIPELKGGFQRSDLALFRFLVARDLNVDLADEMIRKHLQWRKANKIDKIFTIELPSSLEDDFPVYFSGFDKRGCPVIYHPIGKWQALKAVKLGWQPMLMTRLRQFGERLMEIYAHHATDDRQVCQYYGIYDMEGYDYTQLLSYELTRMTTETLKDYLENFPEIMNKIRIINAPRLFQILWVLLEPLLSGRIKSKVEIFGTNKEKWRANLLEDVDPDNLSSFCGGAVTTCFKHRLEIGVDVFPKYETLPEEGYKEVFIPARQKHSLKYELQPGAKLSWNFKTDEYDIGFSVEHESGKQITEYCRADAHKFVQKGYTVASQRGRYTLIFDNSYSKLTGKNLHYTVRVTDPL